MKFTDTHSQSLLPKRFIFLAEEGPTEKIGEQEGVGGVSEEAAERAREESRQTAKASKKQKKEERKARKRDHRLADIIRGFIQGAQKDDKIALLISRLFQRNTPASILLAVMSLNYPDVLEDLENYLEEERDIMPDDAPSKMHIDENSKALIEYGKELALALSEWTRRIFTHASFHPMKSILALAHHHGVDHNMTQLTAFMIQQYFKSSGQDIEFERIKQFSELFWRDALKRLHMMADERGLLPDPSADPLSDEEEDFDEEEEEEEEREER